MPAFGHACTLYRNVGTGEHPIWQPVGAITAVPAPVEPVDLAELRRDLQGDDGAELTPRVRFNSEGGFSEN